MVRYSHNNLAVMTLHLLGWSWPKRPLGLGRKDIHDRNAINMQGNLLTGSISTACPERSAIGSGSPTFVRIQRVQKAAWTVCITTTRVGEGLQ